MSAFPDGWICGRVGIWGEADQRGQAWAGWEVSSQDYRNSPDDLAVRLEESLAALLRSLDPDVRIQWHWSLSGDYRRELAAYAAKTAETENSFARSVREARLARLSAKHQAGLLRREKLLLFAATPIKAKTPASALSRAALSAHYSRLLEQLDGSFALRAEGWGAYLGASGVTLRRLEEDELFAALWGCFNPRRRDKPGAWEPGHNILPQIWRGQMLGQPGSLPEDRYGFVLDGCYHAVVGFGTDRYPQSTYAGLIYHLLSLGISEYRVVLNVYPLSQRQEIKREEYELRRITGDFQSEQKQSLIPAILQKRDRIQRLATGAETPLRWDFGVILWSDSADELSERIELVRARIGAMSGAQDWTSSGFRTAKNSWINLLPGNLWCDYHRDAHKGTDAWVANLIPMSASFLGRLEDPDMLVEGTEGQLVGVQSFISGTPQHAVVLGATRTGKSVLLNDFLCESWPNFKKRIIVEEGDSYGSIVRALGGSRILVHQDADLCLNPLATYGACLSRAQVEIASTTIAGLIGAEHDHGALAAIVNAVDGEYAALAEEWISFDESRREMCGREALAARLLVKNVLEGETFPEAYAQLREWLQAPGENPAKVVFAGISPAAVAEFLATDDGERLSRNVAFAHMGDEEEVELGYVVNALKQEHLAGDSQRNQDIAAALENWLEVPLFSGTSTLRLDGELLHFELGRADERIKAAMIVCLGNAVRNHLTTLPRSQRKLILLEEAAKLLDTPSGQRLVAEYYQQLGKYSAWVCSVVQTYSTFAQAPVIKNAVLGNSSLYLLTQHRDAAALEDANRTLRLPEAATAAVLGYPSPEFLKPPAALFTVRQAGERNPLVGTARLEAEEELLRLSSSKGEDYERRRMERLESLKGKAIDVEALVSE
ncbi:MAG: hypothetical protein PHO89_01260 [Methylacidiphilaceae bacterium]|nr:hypothetical protein [Candidatus Methylacidiphilaceae bacterium]